MKMREPRAPNILAYLQSLFWIEEMRAKAFSTEADRYLCEAKCNKWKVFINEIYGLDRKITVIDTI